MPTAAARCFEQYRIDFQLQLLAVFSHTLIQFIAGMQPEYSMCRPDIVTECHVRWLRYSLRLTYRPIVSNSALQLVTTVETTQPTNQVRK